MHPKSRTDRLIVQHLADETVVYDEDTHRAYCLNRTAALAWRLCDDHTGVVGLAQRVGMELGAPVSEDLVWWVLRRPQRAPAGRPGGSSAWPYPPRGSAQAGTVRRNGSAVAHSPDRRRAHAGDGCNALRPV